MKRIHKCLVIVACLIMAMTAIGLVGCNKTKVESVSLNKTSITLNVGASETLTATVLPKEAKQDVSWSIDNADVATVDENGKVTAVKVGSAKVTVTTKDGNKTAECTVNVIDQVALTADMIKLSQDAMTFTGSELKPTVTVTANGKTVDASEYDVSYTNNVNKGEATVKVTPKSTSTVIKGNAVEKKFTINPADAAANDFTVEVEKEVVEEGTNAKQAPTVKFKNSYTLKDTEYTVKYYADGSTTPIADNDNAFTRQTKISVEVTITKGGNFKFADDTKDLTLSDKKATYDIVSPASAAFFTANKTEVQLGSTKFANANDLTIAKVSDKKDYNLEKDSNDLSIYTIKGRATPFAESGNNSASAFSNEVSDKDSFIVLIVDNAKNKYDIKIGWVATPDTELEEGTTDKKGSVGYKEYTGNNKDHEFIIWVSRPNGTNFFRVEMDDKAYVLDISGLDVNEFVTKETNTVDTSSQKQTDSSAANSKYFKNSDDLKITKQPGTEDNIEIYKVTGTASNFNDTNAAEFNSNNETKGGHSYIVIKLNVKNGEKYKAGWVDRPGDALVKSGEENKTQSAGYKEHTVSGDDHDLILWVTRPDANSAKFFRIEFTDTTDTTVRTYVLDITELKTGSNIFSPETKKVDTSSKESTDNKGFQNDKNSNLQFIEEGNIIKVTGKATKFTKDNDSEYSDKIRVEEDSNGDALTDEYIVIKLNLADNEKYKCGWVKDPDTKFGDTSSNSEAVKEIDTKTGENADKDLILWVTRPGISGYYFRIEINYGTSGDDANKGLRSYVLDLSELKSADGTENVLDFFKVDPKQESETASGPKYFKNGTGANLKIEKQDSPYQYYKITGKATKFNSTNKAAFGSDVKENTDSYVVFRMNVLKGSTNKFKVGYVDKVGDTLVASNGSGQTQSKGFKEVTIAKDNEQLILRVTRPEMTNILCVEFNGISYYLDISGVDTKNTVDYTTTDAETGTN